MAQLDFPLNPALHQVYTAGQGSWIWDGIKWESNYSAQLYLPLTGGALASPGNLAVGGTLNVTGTTTLGVLTTGAVTVNGLVTSQGSNAGFAFLGRDTGNAWTWYAQSGVARLGYGGTDIVTVGTGGALHAASTFSAGGDISTPGNVLGANSVQSSGVYFQNNGGNFYSPQSIVSGGNLTANGGVVYIAGMYWQNNAGYMYTPWSIHTDNAVNIAGLTWSNNSGWMYSSANVLSANAVGVGGNTGIYWNNNGGWMYCPVGVWCSNINTGSIQCNGQAVTCSSVNFASGVWCGNSGGYFYSPQWAQFSGNYIYLQTWGVITNALVGNQHAWWYTGGYIYWYLDSSQLGPLQWLGSDARLKENFAPPGRDCLAAINQIELQSFDWPQRIPERKPRRPDQGPEVEPEALPMITTHWEVGYTAQQVREVIPEAVPDPPALPGEEGVLGVDLRMLAAHLIGAVQQLTRRLEAVEGK